MHQLNGLYLILTNPFVGYEAAARAAVNCHVSMLQLRMKDETNDQQLEIAQTLRTITQGTQTQLIINDNLPLAQRVEADGLHLGQDDLTLQDARQQYRGIIGISTHNLEQAQAAQAAGADYIGIGPIYATQSKSNPDPVVGIDEGSRIAAAVSCPSVAIGGIQIEKIVSLRKSAFDAFCVLGVVNNSDQPFKIIQQLQQEWQDAEV